MAHSLALAWLQLSLLAAPAQPRLAVMAIKAEGGTSSTLADAVTQAVVSEVRRQSKGLSVIGWGEIRALVSMERDKQQLGCDQVSCLAEIGGAIGAASIINGTLTRIGSLYLLALRMVDVRHAQVLKEGTERISSGDEDQLLDAVTRAVHQLFPGAPLPARLGQDATAGEATEPPSHSHLLGISLIAATVVSSGFALYGVLGPVDGYQSEFSQTSKALGASGTTGPAPFTSTQLKGDYQTAQNWEIASSILVAVAVATLVGGIFTW
jgi:TolB-like protein